MSGDAATEDVSASAVSSLDKQNTHAETQAQNSRPPSGAAEARTMTPPGTSGAQAADDSGGNTVIGIIPRYAMPNITSLLPSYTNTESEVIHRAFHTGNYDLLKNLPANLREQAVIAARAARAEATRQFLLPQGSGPVLKSRQDNTQGLFQAFEYMPSRYSLADELASKERVEAEAKRMAVGGKEFVVSTATAAPPKNKEFVPGKLFPYLGGAYEAVDEEKVAEAWRNRAGDLGPAPFLQSGVEKLADKPTKQLSWDMMNNIRKWILQDWEGADVSIFENAQDCWVVKVALATIDSQAGLAAYMNVFIRCNELVTKYRLTKVVEFWNSAPEDGYIYFVMRPPWVRPNAIESFFTLYPLERHWTTSAPIVDMQRTQPPKDPTDEAYPPRDVAASALRFESRMAWGTNFITGTAGHAMQGRQYGGGTSVNHHH